MASCPYCGIQYEIGPAVGNLFIVYPEAESRYWQHSLIEDHQRVLRTRHATQTQLLQALPEALSNARQAQKDMQHPTYLALKRILP